MPTDKILRAVYEAYLYERTKNGRASKVTIEDAQHAWKISSDRSRRGAISSIRNSYDKPPLPVIIEGELFTVERPPHAEILKSLSTNVDWISLSTAESLAKVQEVKGIIKEMPGPNVRLSIEGIISAHEIRSNHEALQVSQALLSIRQSRQTAQITSGLLRALNKWHEIKVYGAIHPKRLREIRRLLGLTQREIAEILGVTKWQYLRYECMPQNNDDTRSTRIPDKAANTVFSMLRDEFPNVEI